MNNNLVNNPISWEDAEIKLNSIYTEHWSREKTPGPIISPPIFRGQSNSDWELRTTLDRVLGSKTMLVEEYHRTLRIILNEASSWSGKEWEIEEYEKYPFFNDFLPYIPIKTYEFMTYLRHHGFPSPLLDWSESPYVAVFFAFRNVPLDAKTVSIFVFQEHTGEGKVFESSRPYISGMGPNVRTHYRHFRQQCEYTLCMQYVGKAKDDNRYLYKPHQLVFDKCVGDQDNLLEIRIPVDERPKVMRKLISMNITSNSLFESEDGFIQGLAEKWFL